MLLQMFLSPQYFTCSRLLLSPRFRYSLMVAAPFLLIGLVGSVLDSDRGYIHKIFLLFLVSCFLNFLAYTGFDERYDEWKIASFIY